MHHCHYDVLYEATSNTSCDDPSLPVLHIRGAILTYPHRRLESMISSKMSMPHMLEFPLVTKTPANIRNTEIFVDVTKPPSPSDALVNLILFPPF
jgi:hypothetical protein